MTDTNIVLLYNGDSLQREKKIQACVDKLGGREEIEVYRYDCDQRQTPLAVEEILSQSLFDANKVVVLFNVQELTKPRKLPKDHLEGLQEYAKTASDTSPFLLFGDYAKTPPVMWTKLLGKDRLVALAKTSASELRSEVQKCCKQKEIEFDPKAINFFIEACGDTASFAMTELDKLILWVGDSKRITLEDCKKIVMPKHEEDVWAITNAIAKKDAQAALQAIQRLMHQGDNEIAIVARIVGSFKPLHQCKSLEVEKVKMGDWAKVLGMSPYIVKRKQAECKLFSLESIRQAIHLLRQADGDLKGGKQTSPEFFRRMILERLIIDLCRMSA